MNIAEVWQRAAEGRSSACVGYATVPAARDASLWVVRVACDVPGSTFAPLLAAAEKTARLLDEPAPLLEQARAHVVGLGRRLLGDASVDRGPMPTVWETLARLGQAGRPAALVLDAVDHADDATLLELTERIENHTLPVAVVLGFAEREPRPLAKALLDALVRREGETASFIAPAPPSASAPGEAAWSSRLTPGVLATLRAAAIVGPTFEVELVAELLRQSALEVLLDLQSAVDAGAPVVDRGDGVLTIDTRAAEQLLAGLLPSLRSAWHARAAELLSVDAAVERAPRADEPGEARATAASTTRRLDEARDETTEPANARSWSDDAPSFDGAAPPAGAPSSNADPARDDPRDDAPIADAPIADAPVDDAQHDATAKTEPAREEAAKPEDAGSPNDEGARSGRGSTPARAGLEEVPAPAAEAPHAAAPPTQAPGGSGPRPVRIHRGARGAALASDQYFAAGELELGIVRLLDASEHAAALGAHQQAHGYATRALTTLRQLPSSPKRRRLEVRALGSLGRIRLTGIGHARGVRFDLESALEPLEAARKLLAPTDSPDDWVEIARLYATACYEQGDLPSLERGLAALVEASHALMSAGASHHAARLLNEQAAITIRMGDPVRAMSLLTESRRLFEDRAREDLVAKLEMAETDHLIATIPLHVRARPGREDDALIAALDHAKAAERMYGELERPVDAARVRETMGRLELARGRVERAIEHLEAAITIQDTHGDVVGLARSTAALAAALSKRGLAAEALAQLVHSTRLYRRKGSALGVAENRRAIEALARALGRSPRNAALLEQAAAELEAAEAELGRIHLPGEGDAS